MRTRSQFTTPGEDSGAPPEAHLPREIYVLAGMAVVVALGFGIIAPAIPLLADQLGVGHAVAGLAISAFAAARFVSAFAHGRLIDRMGERPVLVAGLFVQAAMMTIAAGASSYWVVIGARAVAGVGSAAFTVASLAMVLRMAPDGARGRAASVQQGGFLVGAVAGPAVGGVLTDVSPRLPFLAYAVCLAVGGAAALALLPKSIPASPSRVPTQSAADLAEGSSEAQESEDRRLGLASRALIAALAVNLANGWLLYGVRNSLLPAFVIDELHRTAVWFGAASLVASLAQIAVLTRTGRWADRFGRKPMMIIGASTLLLSAILLVLPASTALFVISMIWMGIAAAFLSSAPAAVVGDVSARSGGRGIALYGMASDLGGITGPLVAGWLADEYSYAAAYASCAVVCAAALAVCLTMQETLQRPARSRRAADQAS